MKELILKRVPPGDRWEDAVDKSDIFDSLTEGLEYAFQKSKGRIKEFHLSSLAGEIYYVLPDPELPPEPPKQYSLYGEEII